MFSGSSTIYISHINMMLTILNYSRGPHYSGIARMTNK